MHLETDVFYRSIKKGWLAPWTPESHRQNQVVVEAILATAVTYARGGYEVVADGIITDWVKQLFVDGARAAGVALDFIVLIPDQAIAAERGRTRSADPLPHYSPYEALYGKFAAEDAAHAVDTGNVTPGTSRRACGKGSRLGGSGWRARRRSEQAPGSRVDSATPTQGAIHEHRPAHRRRTPAVG
uniref:Uncharacterized protein n=1 Tax=Phenylobacterium glaciei TaxID=2803784 RepID=A0A974SAR6_9CAUL|nr:hypothetical protein JKL49_07070 [Phenylobacterium glaciei]